MLVPSALTGLEQSRMIPPKKSALLLASVGHIHSAQTAATGSEGHHIHYLLEDHGFQKSRVCHPSSFRAAVLFPDGEHGWLLCLAWIGPGQPA